MSQYLDSVVQQSSDLETGRYPTIEEYMKNRRDNIGTLPSFVVLGLDLSSGLPDEIFFHPIIVELCIHVSDIITLDNVRRCIWIDKE